MLNICDDLQRLPANKIATIPVEGAEIPAKPGPGVTGPLDLHDISKPLQSPNQSTFNTLVTANLTIY